MVDVGDKVYWIDFYQVRSGTIVKKSKLRSKVWIRIDDSGFVFSIPLELINQGRYYTRKVDAVRDAIRSLEFALSLAEYECRQIPEIKEGLEYWKNVLDDLGGGVDES